jgi:hypothetical protein
MAIRAFKKIAAIQPHFFVIAAQQATFRAMPIVVGVKTHGDFSV